MKRIGFADDSHSYFAYDADSKRVEKRYGEQVRARDLLKPLLRLCG
jgi:hypothetical protein